MREDDIDQSSFENYDKDNMHSDIQITQNVSDLNFDFEGLSFTSFAIFVLTQKN